jgi:hypothetical protein
LPRRAGPVFERSPSVVGASGRLLADSINSAGISLENGLAMVSEHDRTSGDGVDMSIRRIVGLYGCNMAFRYKAIEANGSMKTCRFADGRKTSILPAGSSGMAPCAEPTPSWASIWAARAGV